MPLRTPIAGLIVLTRRTGASEAPPQQAFQPLRDSLKKFVRVAGNSGAQDRAGSAGRDGVCKNTFHACKIRLFAIPEAGPRADADCRPPLSPGLGAGTAITGGGEVSLLF